MSTKMNTKAPTPGSDATADYRQVMRVKASPDAVFGALTDLASLSTWWTRASGSPDAGGRIDFKFGPPQPCVMRVDEANRPSTVRWTVTECDFLLDWVGTRPTFLITPVSAEERGACELRFQHHGLTPELGCFTMCEAGWNEALGKLRAFVEASVEA